MNLLASMSLLLKILLQRPYCGDFDPENAYRKPPVTLEIVPKAGYVMYIGNNRLITSMYKHRKRPMTEKKSPEQKFWCGFLNNI
jgi:hypothetical protein